MIPAGETRISVMRGVVENAICNNRHVDCDNSMMFYGCGLLNNRIIRNRSDHICFRDIGLVTQTDHP